MKRILSTIILSISLLSTTAFAAEYTVEPPSGGIFGTPTSQQIVVVGDNVNPANVDKSKNSALIPPPFGSPTSNLPYSGEPLTPNLADPNANGTMGIPTGTVITSTGTPPTVIISSNTQSSTSIETPPPIERNDIYYTNSFTEVTSNLYYSGGHIATLNIPAINLSVNVFEGTSNATLAKGAGHFSETSIWDGNVGIAAHNRGTNNYFGKIHNLSYGDTVRLTTKLGTKTYEVFAVQKISKDDATSLNRTSDSIITLITCVMNEADYYRWCIQGREIF